MNRDQAHPLPSNVHRSPREYALPERLDPGYHVPHPLSRRDVRQMLRDLPVAILGLIALGAFCALAIAVLAPVPGK